MAELADAPDLGSGVPDVKVQVLFGAPKIKKRGLDPLFLIFYTDYKLELQFALRIALLRAVIMKLAKTLAQKRFLSPFWCTNKITPIARWGLFYWHRLIKRLEGEHF